MLALILENADACRRAGEQWRSEEEVQAIERSLALQLRQLDRDRQPSVTRLFVAESALCNLVLHPEGSTLAFDAERNRLLSEFEAAKTSLRLELGPEPFKAEISQSFKTVIARPAHAQEGAGTP
jgi:hypothetical protein